MNTLLFIRGIPGTGKHTASKIVAESLGWKLFWLHQIDPIYQITGGYRFPRLQDEVCGAILKQLCRQGDNIIFVRSARDEETVEKVRKIANKYDYRFLVVRLQAEYATLIGRVEQRATDSYRVYDKRGLDEYLTARPQGLVEDEHIIWTDNVKPQEVAEKILVLAKSLSD